ncbi:type II secretion system (T2SS) protein M subtype b [Breoghania corrubedonensis]|uniref:Type II secretion system (T2SS) protein M subtype b n=1 Tax=Breoghania corrubedonensis TaxID=665038 RepID=A0A2T5VBE2_9HYPH|nr:type II secretion system protein GspM [Breoghania corrubedonensis]PTW61057.1 type II secretion system (T2SS) protein M subtype b [Breoghania corrubedonensis]
MNDLVLGMRSFGSRVAAVGLLGLCLWGAGAMVAWPVLERYRQLGSELIDVRAQMGRIDAILSSSNETPTASDSSGQSWRGQSRSIVAAKVQEFLQGQARRHAVSVISISPLERRPFEHFEVLGLRIECEGEIGAVRDLIGAMENAKPFLFITGVDLRRQQIFGTRRPDQKLPLAARMDVYAPFVQEAGR